MLGIVAVAVEGDQPAFQYYSSGVITSGCGAQISHSLAVVGYGGGESGTPECTCPLCTLCVSTLGFAPKALRALVASAVLF